MKRSSIVGVVALVLGLLPTEVWAHGLGGVGGFQGGLHGSFGGFQGGFGHPTFQAGGIPPQGPGTALPPHFLPELFFGPLLVPRGLQVVVINTPVSGSAPVQPCGSEAHWEAALGRCQRNRPLASSPPAGVIVLRPEGRQELATACPQRFIEQIAKGWRFCLDPQHLEPVSPLWTSALAGMPYEAAVQILQRHKEELLARPGVKAVGLERGGFYVKAEHPAGLPAVVEGLPLAVYPWQPRNLE